MSIYEDINKLVSYGIDKCLIENEDYIYCYNRLLEKLNISKEYCRDNHPRYLRGEEKLVFILNRILDWAVNNDLIVDMIGDKDKLDTELMSVLVPRPSTVIDKFNKLYEINPEKATDYYYNLSENSNYIRKDRIDKNIKWKTNTSYGDLEITINLSKPEKDPRAIERAKDSNINKYPECLLCKENVGYEGRLDHPPRANHRVLPFNLLEEKWYLQYSPYVYFNEHCIFFSSEHREMSISHRTFEELLECVSIYPHYFAGSNADLPIVGGSILSHIHFQGGGYDMPITRADILWETTINGFEDTKVCILNWPMSIIRLIGKDKKSLVVLASRILDNWKEYNNIDLDILSHSSGTPHNTITPIARFKDGSYQMDLTLRNNRCTEEYPHGIFHPHDDLHHIKKENIGLIEVMGIAILPGRLIKDFKDIEGLIVDKKLNVPKDLAEHRSWIEYLRTNYKNDMDCSEYIKNQCGLKFLMVLEDAGVFKKNNIEEFKNFIKNL